jgi:hypothetical protein
VVLALAQVWPTGILASQAFVAPGAREWGALERVRLFPIQAGFPNGRNNAILFS